MFLSPHFKCSPFRRQDLSKKQVQRSKAFLGKCFEQSRTKVFDIDFLPVCHCLLTAMLFLHDVLYWHELVLFYIVCLNIALWCRSKWLTFVWNQSLTLLVGFIGKNKFRWPLCHIILVHLVQTKCFVYLQMVTYLRYDIIITATVI